MKYNQLKLIAISMLCFCIFISLSLIYLIIRDKIFCFSGILALILFSSWFICAFYELFFELDEFCECLAGFFFQILIFSAFSDMIDEIEGKKGGKKDDN